MNFTRHRSILSLIAAAMLGTVATAQDEPPKDAQPADESQAAEPAPKLNNLRLRYTSSGIKGFRPRGLHHGYFASGLEIDELLLKTPGNDASYYSRFVGHGVGSRDYWMGGHVIFPGGGTRLVVSTQHRSYHVLAPTDTQRSTDAVTDATISQDLGRFGVYANFQDNQRRVGREGPKPNLKPRVRRIAGGLDGNFGSVQAGVLVQQNEFTESAGTQRKTTSQTIGGHVSADIGDRLSVSGTGAYTRIRQNGLAASHVKTLGLAAEVALGDRTALQLDLVRQDISLPNVLSAYDRQRFTTGGRLITKLGAWGFQFGLRHVEVERMRKDRTFVDVPKWNEFDFRLARRLGEGSRLTLRGNWSDLRATAVPNTTDTRQFLWDDKAMLQAKLDMVSGSFAGYAGYTFRFRQNKQRNVQLDWHNFAVGGSYLFNDKVTGYAELSYDAFRGGSRVVNLGEALRPYFASSANFAAGVNITPNPETTYTAAIVTSASNNVYGSQLTLGYRRELRGDRSVQVEFAPWTTIDRLYRTTGYKTTIFSVMYSIKF